MIGLTKEQIANSDRESLAAKAATPRMSLSPAVTFSQVAEALRQQCAPYDSELLAIVGLRKLPG